jgi:NADH-quinone oxidoreductase subunit L
VVNGVLGVTAVLRWFDDTVIDGIVNGSAWLARILSTISGRFDMDVVDGIVNATAYVSGLLGVVLRKFQTGKVQTYILFAVVSVMIFYFVFRLV